MSIVRRTDCVPLPMVVCPVKLYTYFCTPLYIKKIDMKINFMNIRPVGADLLHADRRTDRQTLCG